MSSGIEGVKVLGNLTDAHKSEVLTPEALEFVANLQRQFNERRLELLRNREERQKKIDAGEFPDFLPSTSTARSSEWQVAEPAPDLTDRRVEITGPVDAKMIINALNSGAKVFMAGGNAIDAAVTAAFVQMITAPHMCGVGGYVLFNFYQPGVSIQNKRKIL